MAELQNRDELEAQFAHELGKLTQAQMGRLLELLGDPPKLENVTAAFWEKAGKELAKAIGPFLTKVYLEQARRMVEGTPIRVNWELVNKNAVEWVRQYTFELVKGINDTSKTMLRENVARYFEQGLTIGDLERSIAESFGPIRAEMIAVTEVTRAAVEGERVVAADLREQGIEMTEIWNTSNDDLVCFPAWTLITTHEGDVPINKIKPGNEVLTRVGWRPVIAISQRNYTGKMRRISAGKYQITATADHPVLSEKGWLKIGDFQIGDVIYTIDNQITHIRGIRDFTLGYSNDIPAMTLQISGFSSIAPFVLMPISTIDFQSNPIIRQDEINRISTYSSFLNIFDINRIKSKARRFFNRSFSIRAPITRKGTVTPIKIARKSTKFISASFTDNIYGWAATFFRAEMPIKMLFSNKWFTASFTQLIFCFCKATGFTTNGKTIGNRLINLKFLATLRAYLRYFCRSTSQFITCARTIFKTAFYLIGNKIKLNPALWTIGHLPPTRALSFLKSQFMVGQRHIIQLLSNMNILYHRLFANEMIVYDIEVSEAHEFYANGILVHNCPICEPLNQKAENDGWTKDDGPPAHPRCRCWTNHELPEV